MDAGFGAELQRLLHLLEARREAGLLQMAVDKDQQLVLLARQHGGDSLPPRTRNKPATDRVLGWFPSAASSDVSRNHVERSLKPATSRLITSTMVAGRRRRRVRRPQDQRPAPRPAAAACDESCRANGVATSTPSESRASVARRWSARWSFGAHRRGQPRRLRAAAPTPAGRTAAPTPAAGTATPQTKAETGLPGRPSTGVAPSRPKHQRLARPHGDLPEIQLEPARAERPAAPGRGRRRWRRRWSPAGRCRRAGRPRPRSLGAVAGDRQHHRLAAAPRGPGRPARGRWS